MIAFTADHTGLPSVVTDMVAQGHLWRLTGAAGGRSWLVAEGVGIGTTLAYSDPATPVDAATTWTLAVVDPSTGASVRTEAASLTRELSDGIRAATGCEDTLITSADGRWAFLTTWTGDTQRVWSPGIEFGRPLARRYPRPLAPVSPAGPRWELSCRADVDEVLRARAALDRGIAWIIHSRAGSNAYSQVPAAMLAGVDGDVAEAQSGHGRQFTATVRELDVSREGGSGVPIVTWGEARDLGIVWSGTIPTTFDYIRGVAR